MKQSLGGIPAAALASIPTLTVVQDRILTVQQFAALMQIDEETCLDWIKDGKIQASNINMSPTAQRPRWRILQSESLRLLERQQTTVDTVEEKPRRRIKKATSTVDYFADADGDEPP